MSFLTSVDTDAEAFVVANLLGAYGIMTHLDYDSYGGSLNVILGNSNTGVNIYVMPEDYEAASDILSECSGYDV